MTQTILDSLTRLSPGAREAFTRNRERFLERLDSRMRRWNEMLAPYRGARVVVYHDSWPYFARRFGLVIVAAVEPFPGVPPSPGSLASLTARMKDARVLVLIVEPSANRSVANRMASSSGARVVTLITSVGGDPDASGYVELFELDVRRHAAAFAAAR